MAQRLGCFADPVTLREALSRMADDARMHGRSIPFIHTDVHSAMILAKVLADEIGCTRSDLTPRSGDCVAMFDGVSIVAMPAPRDGYREHFGALADIYADQREST
jgi:hypothetical protein